MEFGKCIQSENSTTQNVKVQKNENMTKQKTLWEMIFDQQKSEN